MRNIRIIPQILIIDEEIYKTKNFDNPKYIGDPINTIKLFNELEADELVIVDIGKTKKKEEINFDFIREIVSEAFMPVTYGGGIKSTDDAKHILSCGVEKILINHSFMKNPKIIYDIQSEIGSQSTSVSIDVIKNQKNEFLIYDYVNEKETDKKLIEIINLISEFGAGEVIINSVDRDGMMNGLECLILEQIKNEVNIPIIIAGGANGIENFIEAQKLGASGIAAGSMFVYHGNTNGILINYPTQEELNIRLQ